MSKLRIWLSVLGIAVLTVGSVGSIYRLSSDYFLHLYQIAGCIYGFAAVFGAVFAIRPFFVASRHLLAGSTIGICVVWLPVVLTTYGLALMGAPLVGAYIYLVYVAHRLVSRGQA